MKRAAGKTRSSSVVAMVYFGNLISTLYGKVAPRARVRNAVALFRHNSRGVAVLQPVEYDLGEAIAKDGNEAYLGRESSAACEAPFRAP
jgi:hypothetical protein